MEVVAAQAALVVAAQAALVVAAQVVQVVAAQVAVAVVAVVKAQACQYQVAKATLARRHHQNMSQ